MKKDIFRIDGGTGYEGYHNPRQRWNGWCQPYFTYEVCQQLSTWVLKATKDDPYAEKFYAIDGEVFHEHEGERYPCATVIIDGVTHYTTDGWVWDCDSDLEEVEQ